jgi:predicted  nucleic acid-binding Zn-ribbon protein
MVDFTKKSSTGNSITDKVVKNPVSIESLPFEELKKFALDLQKQLDRAMERLKSNRQEMDSYVNKAYNLERSIKEMEQSQNQLKKQMLGSEEQKDKSADLGKEIETIKEQNMTLQAQLENLNVQKENMTERVSRYESQMEEKIKENLFLKNELKKYQSDRTQPYQPHELPIGAGPAEMELRKELSRALQDKAELKEEAEGSRQKLTESKAAIKALKVMVKELEGKLLFFRKKQDQFESLYTTRDIPKSNESAEESKENPESNVFFQGDDDPKSADHEKYELRKERERLAKKIRELELEREKMKGLLEAKNQMIKRNEENYYELERLKNEKKAHERLVANLKDQAKIYQQKENETLAQLHQIEKHLLSELKNLSNAGDNANILQLATKELSDSKEELQKLRQHLADSSGEMEKIKFKLSEVLEKQEIQDRYMEDTQLELARRAEKISELHQFIQSMKKENDGGEPLDWRQRERVYLKQIDELRSQLTTLEQQKSGKADTFEATQKQWEEERREYREKLQSTEQQLEELKKKMDFSVKSN